MFANSSKMKWTGVGQLAAVVGERLAAELVDALPHHDGEQKRKAIRRVFMMANSAVFCPGSPNVSKCISS